MPLARINGINLYYETYGEGNPVVLIGGLGSQLQSWATQIELYSRKFRVVVFDNRGAGRSEKPEPGFTLEDMADDTVSLLDFLGIEKASFVGKSMGGMIAQWIGIKYPERVEKLIMGCSSASRDKVGNLILRTGRDIALKAGMKPVWVSALLLGYSRRYIEENYYSIIETLEHIPEDEEAVRGYIGQSLACEKHDVRNLLHKIKAKTLVIYGEKDFITPPSRSHELGKLIPNATLRCFEDVGHGFWREKQKEVDSIVMDFLSR